MMQTSAPPATSAPNLEALIALANDLLNREQFWYSVTAEVRDRARSALGKPVHGQPCQPYLPNSQTPPP